MKKTILGLMPLLVASMLIAGCGKKSESSSAAPTSSSEPASSSSEAEVYTAERVAEDMNKNLPASAALEWDETHQQWVTGANAGASTDESSENLKTGADILASYLPTYMELDVEFYGDPTQPDYIDVFGDGSIYYAEIFLSPDEAVEADILSYIYNSKLCFQIVIYDVEAEQLILKSF